MDRNECCEIEELARARPWAMRFKRARGTRLCDWVSRFHPEKRKCQIDPDMKSDKSGSYNWVCKVSFIETGEAWAVRFPRGGSVLVPDEKVEAEIAAIKIIRQHTDIPVPEIKAYGMSCDNPLGLGPFIISDWINGISSGDVLPPLDGETRLIKDNYPEESMAVLWRQIARFMLQLSRLSFDRIGSCTAIPNRPLNMKSHHISVSGGVDMSGLLNQTFESSHDYFNHIADHDLLHLRNQLNSVDDEDDARKKYINWTVLRQLVPRFVRYDSGPFKLICDDFGPMNMMVDNAENLRIVGVLDWEWSYAGPRELFWSPPPWLLGEPPSQWLEGRNNSRLSRYEKSLDLYIKVLQEEEKHIPHDSSDGLPSVLLRKNQEDGSMWFYHIMLKAFNGPGHIPFSHLRNSVPDFNELAAAVSENEIQSFVTMKMEHLEQYKEALAETKRRHIDLLRQLGQI